MSTMLIRRICNGEAVLVQAQGKNGKLIGRSFPVRSYIENKRTPIAESFLEKLSEEDRGKFNETMRAYYLQLPKASSSKKTVQHNFSKQYKEVTYQEVIDALRRSSMFNYY
ncbi:MAG: hypothetical protein MJ230_01275 [bacterium]|nr:hypothetical protein [bacterium]